MFLKSDGVMHDIQADTYVDSADADWIASDNNVLHNIDGIDFKSDGSENT